MMPVVSSASLFSLSMHSLASAAPLKPMFQISRAFLSITQFSSVQVLPALKPNETALAPTEVEPMQVSLLLVKGGATEVDTGLRSCAWYTAWLSMDIDWPWLPTPWAAPPWLLAVAEDVDDELDVAVGCSVVLGCSARACAPAEPMHAIKVNATMVFSVMFFSLMTYCFYGAVTVPVEADSPVLPKKKPEAWMLAMPAAFMPTRELVVLLPLA